ncbi:MAG: helix-turn-helix domain-containing protein [Candidatus Peribacteria bacterium]|jgi:sugar-specific transcriptional regulator TrmB|nr:helix-turn-helix domain-containing protein [Candidatus Peribacteria bacterium]
MNLTELLMQHHFSEKEAKIYLATLQLKTANISTIARVTGEKRSTTYNVVKELQKKGIINEIDKNNIASYSAIPPDFFLSKLEEQVKTFKECLPAFSAFTEKFGIAPRVEYFEGRNGLLDTYASILKSNVDICCFVGTIDFQGFLSDYLYNKFLPEKLEKKVYSKVIISDTSKNRKLLKKAALKKFNREWKIKDGLSFIEDIAINLYGPDKVMVAVIAEKEPFGLIISSHYLYETLLGIFNFLWK